MGGYTRVTQGALHVKDRNVLPPDRTIFRYDQIQADGTIREVVGTWGDYLRDLDNKRAVDPNTAPVATADNNPRGTMLITDLYEAIPDKKHIPNPLLFY